jgi:hypothetical protein
MTFERLQHITVSGPLYQALYAAAVFYASHSTASTPTDLGSTAVGDVGERSRAVAPRENGDIPTTSHVLTARSPFRLRADVAGGSTANISYAVNDPNECQPGVQAPCSQTQQTHLQNAEPSVAAVMVNNVLHTATVSHKYPVCFNDSTTQCTWFYAYHTTDLINYTGQKLSMPLNQNSRQPAWDSMSDPLMAVNSTSGGQWPGRMYVNGVVFDHSHSINGTYYSTQTQPSAILVWHSDDGGQTWSNAAIADQQAGSTTTPRLLDKPAIAVSFATASQGYVYVVYINYDACGCTFPSSKLNVARSIDGGSTFTVTQVTSGNVEYPAIAVDAQGTVTVVWQDLTFGQTPTLQMAQSTNAGQTFSAPTQVSNTNVVHGQTVPGFSTKGGNSIPMMRYNATANLLSLVYYGQDSAQNFQVYYTYKTCGTGGDCSNVSAWSSPSLLTSSADSYDNHFNPALDYNKTTGNVIIPYYHSHSPAPQSASNVVYDENVASVSATGTLLQTVTVSPHSSISNQQSFQPGFLGDYQDVWDDNFAGVESALGAWVGQGISPSTDTNSDECGTPISY